MHGWQDIVIALMFIPFNLSLIPSIKSKHKPAFSTAIVTGICNFVIAFTDLSLGLYLATFAVLINGSLWMLLAYQKYNERGK